MRTFVKKNLIELADSILEVHEQLKVGLELELRIEYLSICQDSMIAIAEVVGQESIQYLELDEIMQAYCDLLYQYAQELSLEDTMIEQLDQRVLQIQAAIGKIQDTFHVAFLPYKAEMWDALHTVWRAFDRDERCECAIVPIPYYVQNTKEQKWEMKYDGERFPSELSIVHYSEYSLEEIQPDMAFVHNAYDEHNHVTRVHPNYFSYNLKKYVEYLVYIPYYVEARAFKAAEMAWLYESMDYVVLQSQVAKEVHKGLPCYDKILPFGTPKFDTIIEKCSSKGYKSKAWKEQFEHKKVIMLNTSIGNLLNYEEDVWRKLLDFFQLIEKREDICVIWRPHPLLESTMKSMRTSLLEGYQEVRMYFEQLENGILDTTSDLEEVIACCDAYIGDSSSSVPMLFGVVGKPIFFFNYLFRGSFSHEQKKMILIKSMVEVNGVTYVTQAYYNGIFTMTDDCSEVSYLYTIEEGKKLRMTHGFMVEYHGELYLSPASGNRFLRYGCAQNKVEALIEDTNKGAECKAVIAHQNKIVYLPKMDGVIRIYQVDTDKWNQDAACIKVLRENAPLPYFEDYTSYEVEGSNLWICAIYTNKIVKYNMDTQAVQAYWIGESGSSYSAIRKQGNLIWLSEAVTGNVVSWNELTGVEEVYEMLNDLESWENHMGIRVIHREIYCYQDGVVTVPAYSNMMVKVNGMTKTVTSFLPELWMCEVEELNDYRRDRRPTVSFVKQIGEERLLLQRANDGMLIEVNIGTEEYRYRYPKLTEEAFETVYQSVVGNTLGFAKTNGVGAFSKSEGRLFTTEGFLDELVDGRIECIKEAQLEWIKEVVENVDGTCGEKIHEHMMGVLTGE